MPHFEGQSLERCTIRRHVRMDCQVVDEDNFALVGKRVLDVSAEGMLIECGDVWPIGAELLVSFRVPWSKRWFDATAVVTRIIHGRRAFDFGRCLGLHFIDMDAGAKAELASLLMGVPPPVPRRMLRMPARLMAMPASL